MTPFDSNAFNRLAKKIKELDDGKLDGLRAGGAQDFPDYRERVGYLRALKDVTDNMTEIESDLRQGK